MSEIPYVTDSDIIELWDRSNQLPYRFAHLIRDRLQLRFSDPVKAAQIDEDLEDISFIPDGAKADDVARYKRLTGISKERISFPDWMARELKSRRTKNMSNLGSKARIGKGGDI